MTETEALQALEDALRAWAHQMDLYIPRIPDVARALYVGPVTAIVRAATEEVGALPVPTDQSNGNSRWCSKPEEHDTHIWDWLPDPADPITITVRCPGRDGP